ncbi:hypothetical protein [uncultured Psychroserpens sp.]|uniref:hypothetical protein n=1 Tax=uncultured Psychroserpens sp. TaxID=255436 RepID=UPI002614F107|nr:hypothetical protein [uncultured Psychroserpens sp.]
MVTKIKVSTIYECSLERAFKTPMLCDLSKIHTGFGILPKVTHTTDDKDWGKPNSSKKVHMAKSLSQKGGFASIDHIIERKENQYWIIQVDHFQSWMLGFYKFVGEWRTTPLEGKKIRIEYTYFLHSKNPILYPFNWIFGKTIWKIYMKQVLENIRKMIHNKEPYLYD